MTPLWSVTRHRAPSSKRNGCGPGRVPLQKTSRGLFSSTPLILIGWC